MLQGDKSTNPSELWDQDQTQLVGGHYHGASTKPSVQGERQARLRLPLACNITSSILVLTHLAATPSITPCILTVISTIN